MASTCPSACSTKARSTRPSPSIADDVRALEQRHAACAHAVEDVAADLLVDVMQAARQQDRRARDDRRLAAGRLEERAVLDGDLAAADDDAAGRLVVEVLDERGPVVHACQLRARDRERLLMGAEADDEVARLERAPRGRHGARVEDRRLGVQHELDLELDLGLPVHERVSRRAPGAKQLDELQDARARRVEGREEELVGEPLGAVEQRRGLGEEVMRHARLVRAAAAEKRPAVDDEGAPAHRAQVRAAEPAGRAAADEDRVVDAVAVVAQVQDRGAVGLVQRVLDRRPPAHHVELGNLATSWRCLSERTGEQRPPRHPTRTKPGASIVFERGVNNG